MQQFTEEEYAEEWDLEGLVKQMHALYDKPKEEPISVDELREDQAALSRDTLIEDFTEEALEQYRAKEEELTSELMRELERFVILQVVDQRWREHLDAMDYMREGVHLRAMAQKDPLVEYQHEGHIARPAGRRGQRRRIAICARVPRRRGSDRRGRRRQHVDGDRDPRHDRRRDVDRRSARTTSNREVGKGKPGPKRPVLVREREKIQEVPRRLAARAT